MNGSKPRSTFKKLSRENSLESPNRLRVSDKLHLMDIDYVQAVGKT